MGGGGGGGGGYECMCMLHVQFILPQEGHACVLQ